MNFKAKYCILAGILFLFYPFFVRAETIPSGYKAEKESLKSQIETLRAENAEMSKEIKNLNYQLSDRKYALSVLNKSFQNLKDTSADYKVLEIKYDEITSQLSKQNKKVNDLEDEITRLLRKENIQWFFSGVAVFLVGFIIGYSARREKRRSSL